MVDQILEEDDLNKDGYIDYPEFIASQQREDAVAKQRDETNVQEIKYKIILKKSKRIMLVFVLFT